MRYVALLRGIGPMNPNMRNDKLRSVLENLGFSNVETVISSGNVIFETERRDLKALESEIQEAWPAQLGFTSTTLIRSARQIRALADLQPFGDLPDTRESSLQVTFLKHPPKTKLDLPHVGSDGTYRIVAIHDRAVCSVTDLTAAGTPDVMRWMEKTFGKEITTRTWKTVHRILRRMG